MSHTSGPWQVLAKLSGSENHKGFRIWADRGWIGDIGPCDAEGKVGLANAHLIAAAPDLLAALEELLNAPVDDNYAATERAVAAIKKAKGL